jgi:hypothetical protein
MASPLSIILARGYFPKELPPPFNTKSFGAFADTAPAAFHLDITKKGIKNNLTTRAAVHNLARTGTLRRKLTIPNPVNQYQIARAVAEGWKELKSLQQLIEDHAPLHHGSEVVWALWGAICLDCKLDASTVEKSLLASDPCVALCALHARAKGLVTGTVDVSVLEALMHEGELVEGQWLLAYEANVKGWLPNKGGKDFVAAHKHFGPMKAAGVSFYEETATLSITAKPIATTEYTAADDIDIDLAYLLGDVSG